jgi:hypothetical protein
MGRGINFYAVLLVAAVASVLALSEWFRGIANNVDAGLGVYNASSLVNAYWQYKAEHNSLPTPGQIPCYGDSRYVGTFADNPSTGRCDVFSFSRNLRIIIEVAWKGGVFARLEGPDSWDWQHGPKLEQMN